MTVPLGWHDELARVGEQAPKTGIYGAECVTEARRLTDFCRDVPDEYARDLLRMATGDLVLFSVSSLADNVDIRSPSLVGWTPTRLLTGVSDLSLSYLGPSQSAANGATWQRFWINQPQPPQLIRIRLTFPTGAGRVWPDLVIRPQVTLNAACQIDPLTGRCKGAAQP